MKHTYFEGLVLGMTIGFVLCAMLSWMLETVGSGMWPVVDRYGAYVAALLAAYLALRGVSNQIQSNLDLEEEKRLAKLDAARSVLPAVMSNLSALCSNRYYAIVRGETSRPAEGVWELSAGEIAVIKECIEFADGSSKEVLQQVLLGYYVLTSGWDKIRIKYDLFSLPGSSMAELSDMAAYQQVYALRRWATFEAVCQTLFPFSKGREIEFCAKSVGDQAIFTLDWTHSGGPGDGGGRSLKNCGYFFDFLSQQRSEKMLSMDSDVWILAN